MNKIGVIGSGVVGQTLATGLRRHGYDVRIASRTQLWCIPGFRNNSWTNHAFALLKR